MVKLTRGVGSPETGGCALVAASFYAHGTWDDQPPCVCPVIRVLVMALNDDLPSDEERERILGPHLFTWVGTAAGQAVEWRRRWAMLDRLVNVWLPKRLDPQDAAFVRAEVPKIGSLQAAERAEGLLARLEGLHVRDALWAVRDVLRALRHAIVGNLWGLASAEALAFATAEEAIALILDLCAMTERKELPSPAHTREETVRALEQAHALGAARC